MHLIAFRLIIAGLYIWSTTPWTIWLWGSSSSCIVSGNIIRLCFIVRVRQLSCHFRDVCINPLYSERLCGSYHMCRDGYSCPRFECEVPMLEHIRKFIHGNGSISLIMKRLSGYPLLADLKDEDTQATTTTATSLEHSISTWSWCRKCEQVRVCSIAMLVHFSLHFYSSYIV